MSCTVRQGDMLEVLPTLAADSFDSCVTDPPYGIGFMGKVWDSPGSFVEREAEYVADTHRRVAELRGPLFAEVGA